MSTLNKQLILPDVTDMVAHLIWVPELYHTYGSTIKEEFFKTDSTNIVEDESCLAYIWGALKQYRETQNPDEVPSRPRFEVYVRTYLRKFSYDENEIEELIFGDDPEKSFLANLFHEERKELNYASGEPLVRQFLLERAIVNSLIKRVNEMRDFTGFVDTQEAEHIRKISEEASRIEGISANVPIEPLVPELSYFSKADVPRVVPCGIPWIDDRIRPHYDEVEGLVGPTGAGKTTLGCQIFASSVHEAFKDCQNGLEDRLCVYMTYEQSGFELQRTKILTNVFNIDRRSLSGDVNPETCFSRPGNLKPYEIGKFGGLSEYERYYNMRDLFNRHGLVRNMSGVPDPCDEPKIAEMKQHKGHGGIDEIVHELDYISNARGQGIRAVFVDYFGLVIDRQYEGRDEKDRWAAMRSFGDAVRQRVAGKFNCTVWLLHQMSGVANSKNPTVPLRHTDAAGCKSIADNMSNCLCLGNPDAGSANGGKCLYLTFSKVRNVGSSGLDDQNLILQHDKLFARLNNVTGKYQPDKGNACFYDVEEGYY